MSVFEIAVLLAAICGLSMVIGGIFLIYRGAITLAATPHADAITIEFKKQFRINTQAPGIAFFLVGLIFVGIALYASKPPDVVPIDVSGEVEGVNQPVTVTIITRWPLATYSGGKIGGKVYPDMTSLTVEATAPGYLPFTAPIILKPADKRIASIGKVRLTKTVEEIIARQENLPALTFAAPPVERQGSFGAPQ